MSKVKVKDGDLPPDFVEPHIFDQAEMLIGYRPKTVKDVKATKEAPIERVIDGYEKKGAWRYKYRRPLTPKRKVMATLLGLGMSQRDTQDIVSPNADRNFTGHTCMSAKDEQVVERVESNVEEMVAQAKTIIQECAVKAANNFSDAVHAGDMKASGKVLEFCGAFRKQVDTNLNISFGQWLKTTQEDRAIDVTEESKALGQQDGP